MSKVLAVLTLWRNSEENLERSLAQFEAMEKLLKKQKIKVVYGFFENDSADNTPQKLQQWLRNHKGFVISEVIGAPKWGSVASLERVTYQARYRNMALELLNLYYNYDYLLVADSDVHWEPDLIEGMISRLDTNPKWGMVSPNTVQNVRDYVEDTDRPSYFDSWSLKDEDDQQCLTFAANPFLRQEDRELWAEGKPVYCNSAFGSIAMVKAEAMDCEDGVDWAVIDGVEHWEFCAGVRSNGYEVVADPSLHAEIIHKKEVVPHPDVVKYQRSCLQMARATS
jgi:GT2 family glycosyltransferase